MAGPYQVKRVMREGADEWTVTDLNGRPLPGEKGDGVGG